MKSDIYNKFMKQYHNLHHCCPKCGYNGYETTLLGYIFNEDNPGDYKNKNQVICTKCGWRGIYHDLIPDENEYPKPYYIHKKTGNRYCITTDNCMFKENGEWKKNLVLYKTMYFNPDGEYFVRTKEDFENNFEKES